MITDIDFPCKTAFSLQKEAEALVDLLLQFPTSRAWISFSCKVSINSMTAAVVVVIHSEENGSRISHSYGEHKMHMHTTRV